MASDHAGFELRRQLRPYVEGLGHEVVDLGTGSVASVDYPVFGARVGRAVASGDCQRGIVICGTGVGIGIAATKISGIRAAACTETYSARLSRQHNDANVLALGARATALGLAQDIVATWLATAFEGGRHQRRVDQLAALDRGEDIEAQSVNSAL